MRKHFSEHFQPTEAEKQNIWAEALFVFDTNILLNLYRLSKETSLGMMEVLKKLKGRLFLPHQVSFEFYEHREEEIARQVNAFEDVRKYLKEIPKDFKKQFSRHPCIPITAIAEALTKCAEEQVNLVADSQGKNQLNFLDHDDPILPALDALFTDCSEPPYTDADNDLLNEKVEECFQKNLPPCFVYESGQKPKSPTNYHKGDSRVWFQIIKHAGTTKKPIIFVTADDKHNWWRHIKIGNKDRPIGPHFQLIRDIELASGNRFLMYTQESFLEEAPKYLGVSEQKQIIEEIKQIKEVDTDESLVCHECGDQYSIQEIFEYNSHYFDGPYYYNRGCDKYCLACWLGVGPNDISKLKDTA
ncbi:MAG: PIN domain-containing protein [Methylococcaceae bacterium]